MAMDPVNWYIWNNDKDDLGYIRTGATILTTKDQVIDLQRDLKANSLDYYAATRSVWMQRRQAVINDTNAGAAYVEYE
jgi:phospholipid-binding lipoprotein MlaA